MVWLMKATPTMSNLIEWLVMVLDELLIKPMTAFEPVCEAVLVVLVVLMLAGVAIEWWTLDA